MTRWSLVAVGSFALAGVTVVSIALYHWRPLLAAPEFSVTYSDDASTAVPGVAYRMLLRPNIVFVRIPDSAQPRHSWLVADLGRRFVAIPDGPESSPYLHFNHDRSLGVAADSAVKLATPWALSWHDHGFTATAGDARVELDLR